MLAMVTLSISWKWFYIAAVILIAFYGCCRPGEVLKAVKGQLVLPSDLGMNDGPCYLRIQRPKPGRRGMGRTQHAKINEPEAVRFLIRLFSEAGSEMPLYGGTPSAFRLRWNKLLLALGIPLSSNITPGGGHG